MDGMSDEVGGVMRIKNGKVLKDGAFVEGTLYCDMDTGKFVEFPAGTEFGDIMELDCKGLLVAPGFIDIQNNGSFGVDLSLPGLTAADVQKFRLQLCQHGVTSVCPTVVTSDPATYREVLGLIGGAAGSAEDGVSVLGAHLEGPFIDVAKKGIRETEPFPLTFCSDFSLTLGSFFGTKLAENSRRTRATVHSVPYCGLPGVLLEPYPHVLLSFPPLCFGLISGEIGG